VFRLFVAAVVSVVLLSSVCAESSDVTLEQIESEIKALQAAVQSLTVMVSTMSGPNLEADINSIREKVIKLDDALLEIKSAVAKTGLDVSDDLDSLRRDIEDLKRALEESRTTYPTNYTAPGRLDRSSA